MNASPSFRFDGGLAYPSAKREERNFQLMKSEKSRRRSNLIDIENDDDRKGGDDDDDNDDDDSDDYRVNADGVGYNLFLDI